MNVAMVLDTVRFILGYIENEENEKWASKGVINKTKAYDMISKYGTVEEADAALETLKAYWTDLLSVYSVKSNDEKLDRLQSGLNGLCTSGSNRARERIIDIASTQFKDGGCYHQYQPLTKKGNNDIGGGLIRGTAAYINETGDYDILKEQVSFDCNPEDTDTLLKHLEVFLQVV